MKIKHFIPVTSLDIEEFIKAFIYTIYKLYSAVTDFIYWIVQVLREDLERLVVSTRDAGLFEA